VSTNLLDELSAEDRERLLAVGRVHEAAAGEEIARQGAVGNCLYVVESGELAVVRRVPGDEEEILDTAGPGTVVGELAVLDRRPRSASLRAQRSSVVRIIDLRAFENLTLGGGACGHRILRAVALSVHRRLKAARAAVASRVRNAAATLCSARASTQVPTWSAPPDGIARILASLPAFSALAGEITRPMETAALSRGAEFGLGPCAEGTAILLLRGAVSPCLAVEEGLAVSLPVVAPGGFVEYECALGRSDDAAFWRARSPSVIARLPAKAFAAGSPSGAALLYALCRDLAMTLRATTGLAMHLGMTWDPRDAPSAARRAGTRG
jgi:CRP/FNR family transcriptional regulator, cyclic AMP receptor protein